MGRVLYVRCWTLATDTDARRAMQSGISTDCSARRSASEPVISVMKLVSGGNRACVCAIRSAGTMKRKATIAMTSVVLGAEANPVVRFAMAATSVSTTLSMVCAQSS